MAIDYAKFDKNMDLEGLKKDIKEAEEGNTAFKEVPHGTYEIKVVKLELGESKTGKIMLKGQFKVVEGEYKGSSIFMNQLVDEGFKINIGNEFLRSLDVFEPEEIYFESYQDYAELIMDIAEEIDKLKYEYLLEYSENDKGFSQFKIKDIYKK